MAGVRQGRGPTDLSLQSALTVETSPLVDSAAPGVPLRLIPSGTPIVARVKRQLEQVNKELWLVLSVVAIAWLLNSMLSSERMLLGLYTLPTVASAYLYGRRHATLTATASTLLVVYMRLTDPMLFGSVACGRRLVAGLARDRRLGRHIGR